MERTLDERLIFFFEFFLEVENLVFLLKKEDFTHMFSTFAWSYT